MGYCLVEPPLRIDLGARDVDPAQRAAALAADRSGVPGHGNARGELGSLPVRPQPLARIELPKRQETPREEPTQGRLRQVDRNRPRGAAPRLALRGFVSVERAFFQ